MKRPVLILGATSTIAQAVAKEWAKEGFPLILAGRNLFELERLSEDIQVRFNTETSLASFDVKDTTSHAAFCKKITDKFPLEGVFIAVGELGVHEEAVRDFNHAEEILTINFTGVCSLLTELSNYFEKERTGFIVVCSSVAGDRGRQSNYIYGSAKAGLNAFLQGLRNRLHPAGVKVTNIKLGPIDTQMTFGRPNLFLVETPEIVAKQIVKVAGKKDEIYIPKIWSLIMGIVKAIPESLFKRLKL